MSLEIYEKTITPEEAAKILSAHKNYRMMSNSRVAAYSKAMTEKSWGISIIIFDEDGELIDGQTRLAAVIRSGIPQTFACVTGWDRAGCIYLDNGQPRTRSQVAKAERNVKDGHKVMSMVCAIEDPTMKKHQISILNSEALKYYDKYGKVCEEILDISRGSKFGAAVHLVSFARCVILYPRTREDILTALNKVKELDFSTRSMSGLKLYYRWAIERGFSKGGADMRREAYLRSARAIVGFIGDEEMQKLYCPTSDPLADDPLKSTTK